MIRRLNYTDRSRIRRTDVSFSIVSLTPPSFTANLSSLSKYRFPPESRVFVEAYRLTTYMRFDCGRIGALEVPKAAVLTEFDTYEGILFRVKVSAAGESHKLLGEADRVALVAGDGRPSKRQYLLPVKAEPLGADPYKLEFEMDDRPLLLVNSEFGDHHTLCRSPYFFSLVYPAVFRQILTRFLIIDRVEDDEQETDNACSKWLKFAKSIPGCGELPSSTDIAERLIWIDGAVTAFNRRIKAVEKFNDVWKGNEAEQ